MDLSTTYMGLRLPNPLIASPSPLSYTLDGLKRLAAGGVGAVVLHSLFEEELAAETARHAILAEAGIDSFAESLTYFPDPARAEPGPHRYLSLLDRAARSVEIPVIASLNGVTPGGWTGYARQMADAGAAAIELNVYWLPGDPHISGRDVELRLIEILTAVKSTVDIPVAVKLSPYFSSVGAMAVELDRAGADALVLFNRFIHPDVDPESLQVVPGIGLSQPSEARLPRIWIALLRGRLRADLAASTGVEGPEDLAKYLLAGADVVMCASALLRHGPQHAAVLVDGLSAWMARKGFDSIDEVRGMFSVPPEVNETAHERAQYVAALRLANARAAGPW
jgi:dihydroorotate dehydrogenase (fumarate)